MGYLRSCQSPGALIHVTSRRQGPISVCACRYFGIDDVQYFYAESISVPIFVHLTQPSPYRTRNWRIILIHAVQYPLRIGCPRRLEDERSDLLHNPRLHVSNPQAPVGKMRSFCTLSAVFFLATNVLATPSSVATTTCANLQRQLGAGIVQTPSGPEYLNASSGAWNFFNAIQRPACVVFPVNSGNVQAAMTAIFKNNIRYAVQAGSHTAMQGWNKYGETLKCDNFFN